MARRREPRNMLSIEKESDLELLKLWKTNIGINNLQIVAGLNIVLLVCRRPSKTIIICLL